MGDSGKMRQLLVRLEPDLYDALARSAAENDRTLSAEVRRSLRHYLTPTAVLGNIREVEPRFKR